MLRHQPRHRPIRDAGVPVAADRARRAADRAGAGSWRARRRDSRRFRQHRRLPVRERFPVFGNLVFWLCLILASACTILALARPTAAAALVRTAGVDLVILQDGSASMRTAGRRRQPLAAVDAVPARARRIAGVEGRPHRDGAVRAHRGAAGAADQGSEHVLLLPRSPRRRSRRSGSRTTRRWDTNIELGIAWGMRLIEKDTELYGKSPNAKAFVLVTDGQAWSGEVARALKTARTNDVPVFVVGVGTTVGAFIPEPRAQAERHVAARAADPRVARSRRRLMTDRQRRRRRVPGARSRGRPRNLEPHHRRRAQARRIARAARSPTKSSTGGSCWRRRRSWCSACCSCRRRRSCGCRRPARPSR